MIDEVRFCPYCDGEIFITERYRGFYMAYCQDCSISGPVRNSKKEAAEAWNIRPREDILAARITVLEATLAKLMEILEPSKRRKKDSDDK
jgi:hypothetical protein